MILNLLNAFAEIAPELAALRARQDLSVATFAGGCFWCMEGPFEAEDGVAAAVVGFAGGHLEDPSYREVVSGGTGHRESVQVFYDATKVSYQRLLEIFWLQIDPTDPGGQFADRGEHYMSAVFYHSPEQQREVERQITELNKSGKYELPITTAVLPYKNFYPAEDYHQGFYLKQAEYYAMYKKGSGRADYIKDMERRFG